jgi:glycogen synthase
MRVLMTADTVGGVWRYALVLADALCRRGVEVHLASMGRLPDRGQLDQADAITGLTLHPGHFRLCWMEQPWEDVERAGSWLARLAARLEPEVVHLNDFGHAAMAWPAPVLLVAHSCVLSWWRAVHLEEPPPEWSRYQELVRTGLRRADRVVAPTRAMAGALYRHYAPPAVPQIIPNGLAAPASIQTEKDPLILSAGRLWDEGKNVRALVETAADLPWKLVIAGDGADTDPRQTPEVEFTGHLDPARLQTYYARAAIFALPAYYEPFGLAALEAGANGCALVLGDIPSLREVWGDAALYVDPQNHRQLRATLQGLIERPDLRRRYATRAAARARRYGVERMTEAYLQTYDQLANPTTTSRRA